MNNQIKSLSDDQVLTLMRAMEKRCMTEPEGLRDYLIVSFMLHAGLRLGEVITLTSDMVSLEWKPLESIRLDGFNTKTGKDRVVPMCKLLRGALAQYLQSEMSRIVLYHYRLFPGRSPRNPNLSDRAVQKMLERISLRCLGFSVNPHMLRHTYATRMMKLTDMRTVQALLGHASIKSTQVYTHPSVNDLNDACKALDIINKDL